MGVMWRIPAMLCLLISPVQVCSGLDLTLQQDAMGADVVRSVLSRIRDSNAFDEPSTIQRQVTDEFIREMAYVESSDGTNNPSDVHDGGIWRMNRNIFEQTRQYNYPILFNRICQFFCIDWRKGVRYSDLRRPLYSGLAVKIYLHNISHGFSYANSDEGRASFWISNFGRSAASGSRWMTSVRELRSNEVSACRVNTDVMFVLESSESIGRNNFERMKDYAYNFTQSLLNRNQNSRIGVITYSYSARVKINMSYVTPMLLQNIRNLSYYTRGGTNTPEGLCLLTLPSHTPWRNEISIFRFAIVLTDGYSNRFSSFCMDHGNRPGTVDSTSARVHALDPQVVVFAIGVGNVAPRELNVIATSPTLVDMLDSFNYRELEQNQRSRAYILCYEETQAVTVGGEENGSVEMGTVSRLQFSGLASEGVTVRVCINQGSIVIYGSYTTRNPSAAFHDFSEVLSAADGEVTPVKCHTTYVNVMVGGRGDSCSMCKSNTIQRKKRQTDEVTAYITIEGMSTNESEFSINSSRGNVMFDVNECTESSDLCGVNAECRNTDGSYYCQCLSGYRGDGQNCSNINECMEGVHMCNETEDCIETEGSYSCECVRGFYRIGQHCERLVIRALFHDVTYVIVLGALCAVALLTLLAAIIIYKVFIRHRRNDTK